MSLGDRFHDISIDIYKNLISKSKMLLLQPARTRSDDEKMGSRDGYNMWIDDRGLETRQQSIRPCDKT